MTYQEYRNQKNKLQNQINKLDKEWTRSSCVSYGVNIGKYYMTRKTSGEFGKITYSVEYIKSNATFIDEDEFYELYDKVVKKLRDKF